MNLVPIAQEDAFGRGLPKWPQMLVMGKDITHDQAKEIIFATDTGLTNTYRMFGNNKAFVNDFNERVGYNKIDRLFVDLIESSREGKTRIESYLMNDIYSAREVIEERAGFLSCEYVKNNWASSSFIFGAYGWCHPTGKIRFIDNVGKWPAVQDVYNDWSKLAERWKFLDLYVTLMNGEEGTENTVPIVTFHVHDGIVDLFEGSLEPFGGNQLQRDLEKGFAYRSEQGLPHQWIEEFIVKTRLIVDQALKEVGLN